MQYTRNLFGKNFKFHSNLNIPKSNLSYFPSFWKKYWIFGVNIIQTNLSYLQPSSPNICGLIVVKKLTTKSSFRGKKNINFVNNLIKENRKLKTWEQIARESEIEKNLYFKWTQIVHAIPNTGKKTLKENTTNSQSLPSLRIYLIKNKQIHSAENLTVK